MHPLQQLLSQRQTHLPKGIVSICTANERVLKACFETYRPYQSPLLIEATANQVNQDGGYTGMVPADFVRFVHDLAQKAGFPAERLFLGGDHLGPLTWSKLPEAEAMAKSEVLVEAYVTAGFTKIHLDTSMRLGDDDPHAPLATQTIARRGIRLMEVAEKAYRKRLIDHPEALAPVYIVGSEVPIPGGAQEAEETVVPTKPEAFLDTVEVYRQTMAEANLSDVWPRVLAVVVQPGVEFGDHNVHEYDRQAAKALIESLKSVEGLVFEGHSTDYQTRQGLSEMVEDSIAILKVGPALTFALREGLYALAMMENALVPADQRSNFIRLLDEVMLEKPQNWNRHYHGDEAALAFARQYSFSDRSRYYMPDPRIEAAIATLIENTREVPYSLLSQFMPIQYKRLRDGLLPRDPEAWVRDVVRVCLIDYLYAVEGPF